MFNRLLSRSITMLLAFVLLLSGWPGTGTVSAAEQDNQRLVMEWSKQYSAEELPGYISNISPTSDGGYVAAGYVTNGAMKFNAYVAKLSSSREVEWELELQYEEGENCFATSVFETRDGEYLVAGMPSLTSIPQPWDSTVYLTKLNAEGSVLWERDYDFDGSYNQFGSVIEAEDGGYLVSGSGGQDGKEIAYVFKTDQDGNELWNTQVDREHAQSLYDVIPASDGGAVAVGRIERFPNSRIYDALVVKFSSNGEVQWTTQYSNTDLISPIAASVIPAAAGDGYLISGYFDPRSTGYNPKYFMIKVSSNGEIIWEQDIPTDGKFRPHELVNSPHGSLLIGAYEESNDHQPVMFKMNETTGELVSRIVEEPQSNSSFIVKLTITPDGGVAAIGFTGKGEAVQYQLMKYRIGNVPGDSENPGGQGAFYLDSEEYSLTLGDQFELEARFRDEQGQVHLVNEDTVFTIEDSSIATIDELGSVKGMSPGITYITAKYQGHTYKASIWIVRPYNPQR